MPFPQAYFITWSTYGTRLHGDHRGTVDREHNIYGHAKIAPNDARTAFENDELTQAATVLTPIQRHAVTAAILEHAGFKSWPVHALNARTNHVHVVCTAQEPPERVMNAFKAYATRRLRADRLAGPDAKIWTRHGSTRYLWDGNGLQQAVDYVTRLQG